tara:strand:- start:3058 stop:3318 length:261 start_codon:yes stop_codon:yes gene_type:complete
LEQKRTCSQSRTHFLRHWNGLPQLAHIFSGRLAFFNIFVIFTGYASLLFAARPIMLTGAYHGHKEKQCHLCRYMFCFYARGILHGH